MRRRLSPSAPGCGLALSATRAAMAAIAAVAIVTATASMAAPAPAPAAAAAATPDSARQAALVRLVRQDCGACHGMRLTGGLGSALTPQALADRPASALVATLLHGRPGTPMPPWRGFLSEPEAAWVVEQLRRGFPVEPGATPSPPLPATPTTPPEPVRHAAP